MISQKINDIDALKKITDKINLNEVDDKIENKNEEVSQSSYKNDYLYYIKNPNVLADKIVDIYINNPQSKPYNPKNKKNNVKLQNVVNRIDKDIKIDPQYKEFVNEFRNIHKNTYIESDYETYKELVLDRINKKDDSTIKEIGKKFIKNLTGQGVDEYKIIKIDKDALKKNILKIRYNNGRKLNNKYLHDDMIISNNMKNAIMKNNNINKLSKNEYHVYTLLSKYNKGWRHIAPFSRLYLVKL